MRRFLSFLKGERERVNVEVSRRPTHWKMQIKRKCLECSNPYRKYYSSVSKCAPGTPDFFLSGTRKMVALPLRRPVEGGKSQGPPYSLFKTSKTTTGLITKFFPVECTVRGAIHVTFSRDTFILTPSRRKYYRQYSNARPEDMLNTQPLLTGNANFLTATHECAQSRALPREEAHIKCTHKHTLRLCVKNVSTHSLSISCVCVTMDDEAAERSDDDAIVTIAASAPCVSRRRSTRMAAVRRQSARAHDDGDTCASSRLLSCARGIPVDGLAMALLLAYIFIVFFVVGIRGQAIVVSGVAKGIDKKFST